jgi:hypothetical protein
MSKEELKKKYDEFTTLGTFLLIETKRQLEAKAEREHDFLYGGIHDAETDFLSFQDDLEGCFDEL